MHILHNPYRGRALVIGVFVAVLVILIVGPLLAGAAFAGPTPGGGYGNHSKSPTPSSSPSVSPTASPTPALTLSPTPTLSAGPVPTIPGPTPTQTSGLPVTGPPAGYIAAGGAAAILAGVLLMLLRRRGATRTG